MSVLNPDPSLPSNPAPIFADTDAARGDHLRANNNKIWGNFTDLDSRIDANFLRTIYGDNAYGSTLVTDLNAITKSGFYTCLGTATGTPSTSYSWFVLHQNSAVGIVSEYQRAVAFDTTLRVYERLKIASTWGAWKESYAEPTGVEKMYFGDVIPSGWLLEDGKSIANSGGDYNGASYYTLYAHMWDLVNRAVIPSTYLSSAKGASASADWSANKKIYLPNRQALSPKGAGTQTLNTRSKTGPALGVAEEDRGHGHIHASNTATGVVSISGNGTSANITQGGGGLKYNSDSIVGPPIAAGSVETPRTGETTRDCTLGTNFIIKI